MKKSAILLLALALPLSAFGEAEGGRKLWFHEAGDYLATRSVQFGMPTEATTKVLTDGKRFDVTVGKRISLFDFGNHGLTRGWTVGIDGGMLASLVKYSKDGNLTFATHTFDGFFGVFAGYQSNGWVALLRMGHLSAHLVDNDPNILNAVSYSQFWNEAIVGKTFPHPDVPSNWEVHLQTSLGMNNTSVPKAKQPRASGSISGGWSWKGPDSLAVLASLNAMNPGVTGQAPTYNLFLGLGTLNRPNSTHRPFRVGLAHFSGSDFRNQFYYQKQSWTTAEVSTEF
jgi:hypothetical protein